MTGFDNRAFLTFIILVSLAFAWVVSPFYGAILWAVVAAIVFEPLNRRIARILPRWPNIAALVTLWSETSRWGRLSAITRAICS